MRFLDIALATLIGTSAITGIIALSPSKWDDAARRLQTESALRDTLLGFLQRHGAAWFVESQPTEICSVLFSSSNSTIGFTGVIGGMSCGPPPPPGAVSSSLIIQSIPEEIELRAWSDAKA